MSGAEKPGQRGGDIAETLLHRHCIARLSFETKSQLPEYASLTIAMADLLMLLTRACRNYACLASRANSDHR